MMSAAFSTVRLFFFPASGDGVNMPRIICVPSCHTALPQMTLMLIPLCEEELTRQPIFNSSAAPPRGPASPQQHSVMLAVLSYLMCVLFVYVCMCVCVCVVKGR